MTAAMPDPAAARPLRVLCVISGLLPYPAGMCGVPVVTWSVLSALLGRGHEVAVCTFMRSRLDRHRTEALALLASHGVRVHDLDDRVPPIPRRSVGANRMHALRAALAPRDRDLYPQIRYAAELGRVIEEERPDVLYVWDFPAAAAVTAVAPRPPGLLAVVNLDHVAHSLRRRTLRRGGVRDAIYGSLEALAERRLPALETRIASGFEHVVDHAAHHAAWLRARGVEATYLPNPVVDAAGPDLEAEREAGSRAHEVPEILFIGRLDSTINQPALEMLALEILPLLDGSLGDGFRLEVVGQGEVAPGVAAALDHPRVRSRGYVDSARAAFVSSDILLVPTPDPLGFRTRVVEGFSLGCCVVSHSANAEGMPELRHDDNVLLGANARDLAAQIARAAKDAELRRRIGRAARRTYERELSAGIVCGRIVDEIEAIATRGVGAIERAG